MVPYYEDEWVTLYHGDCREVSGWLSGDVMVTDPPYGMRYRSSQGHVATVPIVGDDSTALRDWVVSEWGEERPALVFGTWRVPRPKCRELLVWHKTKVGFSGDLSLPWGPCHEEIYVIGKGFSGRRRPNVLSFPGLTGSDGDRPDHPTPKPVGLMRALLECCPSGVVVDPFAGSGSTLRAAKDLGRRAVGVEVEERFCEVAARRLAQDVLPLGV